MAWNPDILAPLGPRGARLAYDIEVASQEGRDADAVRLLTEAGDALVHAQEGGRALQVYDHAYDVIVDNPEARRLAGDVAWRVAQVHDTAGRALDAAAWYQHAEGHFGADGAKADQVVALQAAARCRAPREGAGVALRLLGDAIDIARELDDPALLGGVMEQAAETSASLTLADEAAAQFREARALYARAGDTVGLVRATIGQAECELDLGDHVRAIETLAPVEEDLEIGLDAETSGRGLGLVARFYLQAGELEEASAQFVAAIEKLTEAGAEVRRAELMLAFGRFLLKTQSPGEVLPLLVAGLTIYQRLGDRQRMAPAAYSVAKAYFEGSQLVLADEAIEIALGICQELGDVEGLDVCTRLGVRIAIGMSQGKLALERLKVAARVRAQLGDYAGELRYLFQALEATFHSPDLDSMSMADELIEALRRTGPGPLDPEEVPIIAQRFVKAGRPSHAQEAMAIQASAEVDAGRLDDAARSFAKAAEYAVQADSPEDTGALYDQAIAIAEREGLPELEDWRLNRERFGDA